MPRQGDGSSDNGPFKEAQHDILHGTGPIKSDHVARADKTAAIPEPDKGLAIEGLNASGAGYSLPSLGNQGKGSLGHEPKHTSVGRQRLNEDAADKQIDAADRMAT